MFTQHDKEEHLRVPLLLACHRTLQEGKADIGLLSLGPGTQKETLGGRGEETQHQEGSSGQKDKYGFQLNSPKKSWQKDQT